MRFIFILYFYTSIRIFSFLPPALLKSIVLSCFPVPLSSWLGKRTFLCQIDFFFSEPEWYNIPVHTDARYVAFSPGTLNSHKYG